MATWNSWVYGSGTTTTAATSTNVVWQVWSSTSGSATSSGTGSGVWMAWSSASSSNCTRYVQYAQMSPPRKWTAKEKRQAAELAERERAAAAERRREWDRKQAEEDACRKEAARKAEELLRRHLTEEQSAELERDRAFHVVGQDGERYRVSRGRSGNVAEVNAQGRPTRRYCVHPVMDVPDADTMLAQKLLLEADVATFKRVANMTPLAV